MVYLIRLTSLLYLQESSEQICGSFLDSVKYIYPAIYVHSAFIILTFFSIFNFLLLTFPPLLLYAILVTSMFLYVTANPFLSTRKEVNTYLCTYVDTYIFTRPGFFSSIFSLIHHRQKKKCLLNPFYIREHRISD